MIGAIILWLGVAVGIAWVGITADGGALPLRIFVAVVGMLWAGLLPVLVVAAGAAKLGRALSPRIGAGIPRVPNVADPFAALRQRSPNAATSSAAAAGASGAYTSAGSTPATARPNT